MKADIPAEALLDGGAEENSASSSALSNCTSATCRQMVLLSFGSVRGQRTRHTTPATRRAQLSSYASIKHGTSTTLHYATLHYATLHYTTLHYTTLHYTTLHYTTLHYTTLHYTTLHYTTPRMHMQTQKASRKHGTGKSTKPSTAKQ